MAHTTLHHTATDEEIFAAYVQGDEGVFDILFQRWAPRIASIMSQRVSRRSDVQELVQQTFLQVHRARFDFRPGAALRPWIVTIALNVRRYHTRGASKRRKAPWTPNLQIVHPEAERRLHVNETRHEVQQALTKLKPLQRQVIELHWFDGLSFAEIGRSVGASRSAVKVRAHRGYAALRALLTQSAQSMVAAA